MSNIYKHNLGDAVAASSILSEKLANQPNISVDRISPTAIVCNYDEDGNQACRIIVTNDTNHYFGAFGYGQDNIPVPAVAPSAPPVEVGGVSEDSGDVSCSGQNCPTCGQPMPTVDATNDPNIPDDTEIVAIVHPHEIYGHIPDYELHESVEQVETHKVKSVVSKIPHKFKTIQGASKHIENAMAKKYKGKVTRQSSTTFSHLREDGTYDKVISEDAQFVITSFKI